MKKNNTTAPSSGIVQVYHRVILLILGSIYCASISFFFVRLFYPSPSLFMIPDFGVSDVLHLNLPLKYFLTVSLHSGRWPLWSELIGNGFPVLAEGQIGTFFLPNLLLFRFLDVIPAYNSNLVLTFVLLGIGTYLSVRGFGFTRISSVFAAFIFTFCGFFSVHLNHFNLLQACSMFPFMMYAAGRMLRSQNIPNLAFFSFLLSQQIFAGHFYIVLISMVGVTIYWTVYIWQKKANKKFITLLYFAAACICGIGLSAIQIMPTLELLERSSRSGGLDFDTVTSLPYPPQHIVSFVYPYIFGSPADATYPHFGLDWGIFWENSAYLGVLPLIYVLISLFGLKKRPVITLWCIFIISLLLVLGKYSPLYFFFSIPPFSLFRVPSKYLLLTAFSLSVLASYAIHYLQQRLWLRHSTVFVCILFLSIGITVYDEYRFSYTYPPVSPAYWWTSTPEILTRHPEGRTVSISSPVAWNAIFLKDGWKNMHSYTFIRNSLMPNYNMMFSVPSPGVYTGGMKPRRVKLYEDLLIGEIESLTNYHDNTASLSAVASNMLNLQSINTLYSIVSFSTPRLKPDGVFTSPDKKTQYSLYKFKNSSPRPQAYISYSTHTIHNLEDSYQYLKDDKFSLSGAILIENGSYAYTSTLPIRAVEISRTSPTEIGIRTESDRDGILVLADSWYPGWKATIQDKPVEVIPVNINQRGVRISQGSSTVRFFFEPESFTQGKYITVITMVIMSVAVFLSVSRRQRVLS